MVISNSEIAQKFDLLADLLELEEENPFRIRAYRYAARSLLEIPENVAELLKEGRDLSEFPGIGKDLASKIKQIVESDHLDILDKMVKKVPPVLVDLLKIPTLGPKRVKLLYKKLKIQSLDDLKAALDDERILKVKGFGEKMRATLLEELEKQKVAMPSRKRLNEAESTVKLIVNYLKNCKEIKRLEIAGSFRRQKETIGDLDFIATTSNSEKVIDYFTKLASIDKILSRGKTKVTAVLGSGLQVDLRVVSNAQYGAALLYFTGSKAHNIALRKIARRRKLKINEYGVFKGETLIASKTEEEIYNVLKMSYIPPEIREDHGEIDAAEKGTLPKLIELGDIRGDLHAHTKETDGKNSLQQMVKAAVEHGYDYIGITDHSQRIAMSHGLDEKRLLQQIQAIEEINNKQDKITVLKGIEVDILEDGSLDLSNGVLSKLDYTVCSIHSKFNLGSDRQTERVLRAMKNPYFKILGHPFGRLLGKREPYEIDMERIIREAAKYGYIIEINAQPDRMDLPDVYCRIAKRYGVKMVISTDSHSIRQLDFMKYGVSVAKRGWLEKSDIINTLSLEELKNVFRKHKKREQLEQSMWL
ncbi:MAG: DNA polymerase/3'-5' exonuclease PolX [Bdellovibrio sp.]